MRLIVTKRLKTIETLLKARHINRQKKATEHFFSQEMGARLIERVQDHSRQFENILEITTTSPSLKNSLKRHYPHANYSTFSLEKDNLDNFSEKKFDLIISNLTLPWIQNHKEALLHFGRMLEGDGVFMANLIGHGSFQEFALAFRKAGSSNAHISPFPDIHNVGSLLQSLKFALPVVDRDSITLYYDTPAQIYADLKQSGSTNLHPQKSHNLIGKNMWQKMEQHLPTELRHGKQQYPLTIEVIHLHACRPHKNQQQPQKPGSATVPLSEVLK